MVTSVQMRSKGVVIPVHVRRSAATKPKNQDPLRALFQCETEGSSAVKIRTDTLQAKTDIARAPVGDIRDHQQPVKSQ